MFHGITNLPTFVIGTIVIVLLPGPNSLYVMSLASRFGVGTGYRGAAGVWLGDAILMLASALGAASLLRAQPAVFLAVKCLGAAYLAWLGIKMLLTAVSLWRTRDSGTSTVGGRSAGHPFRTALMISLMNPKAILFFLSFFVQFVDPNHAAPALSFLMLGLIVQACSVLYLTALIFGGTLLAAQVRRRRKASAVGTGLTGTLFLVFGAKLASASLR